MAERRGGHCRSGGGGCPAPRVQQHPRHPHAGGDHPGRLHPGPAGGAPPGRGVPGLRVQRDHHLLLHLPLLLRQDPLGPRRAPAPVPAHPQPPGGGHLHHAHHHPALHAGGAGPERQLPQPGRPALRGGQDLSPRRARRTGQRAPDAHPGRLRGGHGLFRHQGGRGGPAEGAAGQGRDL